MNSLGINKPKKETKVEGEHTILASEVQIEENEKPQGALEQAPAPAASAASVPAALPAVARAQPTRRASRISLLSRLSTIAEPDTRDIGTKRT